MINSSIASRNLMDPASRYNIFSIVQSLELHFARGVLTLLTFCQRGTQMTSDQPDTFFEGEEEWIRLQIPQILVPIHSFLHSDPAGDRVRLSYFALPEIAHIMARVAFGTHSEGPPGHVHGGCQASVLDEVMGLVTWYTGHHCLSGRLCFDYLRPIPVGSRLTAEGWIERQEGKKVYTAGKLFDEKGRTYTKSSGVFIDLGRLRFVEMLEERLTPNEDQGMPL